MGVISSTADQQLPPLLAMRRLAFSWSGLFSTRPVNRLKFVKEDYACYGKWVRQWARFYGLVYAKAKERGVQEALSHRWFFPLYLRQCVLGEAISWSPFV